MAKRRSLFWMVGETFDVDTDRNSKPHEEAEMYNVPGLSRGALADSGGSYH